MKLVELKTSSKAIKVINLDAIADIAIERRWVTIWYQNSSHIVITKEEYNKKLKRYVRKDTGFWRRAWSRLRMVILRLKTYRKPNILI